MALSIACVEPRDGAQWRVIEQRAWRTSDMGTPAWDARTPTVTDAPLDGRILALEDAA